jgi:hypothetical protein
MAAEVFEVYEGLIVQLLSEGRTYEEASMYINTLVGYRRGLSSRSLRRFCDSRGLRNRPLNRAQLDSIVASFVRRFGHSYGRRMMYGVLSSRGVQASQRRIGEALQRVAPIQYAQRRHEATALLNPLPYRATYFGEKLHLDQNEKCVMFGITHVVAVDGYSRKFVGFITIPPKNLRFTLSTSPPFKWSLGSGPC